MVKLGQRLHTLRLQRKVTLEQVAAEIKIKASFLAAIERSEYNKLPSPAYAQGFVRNYASYLGLSRAEITALFKREFDEKRAYKVLPDSLIKTKEFPLQRMHIQQSLVFFVIIFILVVGYLFVQYRAAFLPPSLEITAPQTDSTTSQDLTVTGKADSNATVTINDQPVAVQSDGEFSKQITLFPGDATLSVKATNRFGKVSTIQRNIVVH